jgi:hypothetical protein
MAKKALLTSLKIMAKTGYGRTTPGRLRRNRKFSKFSPQSENIKGKSDGYAGEFL